MSTDARRALKAIRDAVAAGRYRVLRHFASRMAERGLVLPDVLAVLDSPDSIHDDGMDRFGRPKWILSGRVDTDALVEFVCAMDTDEKGNQVVLITIYWT